MEIKRENNIKFLNKKVKDLYRVLKTKFAMFFIFSLLLLLFFTYYITCFCGIYVNTQFHLLKDSAISFGLSLLYPFLIYLIPGIFRIPSLNAKNKNKQGLYNFSLFIQNL